MNAKYKYVILAGGIFTICLFTYKGAVPLAYQAAQSSLFMKDTEDEGSREATTNEHTDSAFNQCNEFIKDKLGSTKTIGFSPKPINAWGLGDYEYLINADATISDNSNPATTERYACRIHYDKGNDSTGLSNKDNWSILGVSGIEGL